MKKKVEKKVGPAIDSTELIIAMEELEKEKGISQDKECSEGISRRLFVRVNRNSTSYCI